MSVVAPSRIHPLSPSPASPILKDATTSVSRSSQQSPQTPNSPTLMSVSTKSYASSLAHTSPTEAASQFRPNSSSESGNPLDSHSHTSGAHSQQDSHATNPFPTPADSTYGTNNTEVKMEDIAKHTSVPSQMTPESRDKMDIDTNTAEHDQSHQNSGESITTDADQGKVASDEISLEQIQKDMGKAFLTCRTTLHRTRPDPSENMLFRYGLGPTYQTVARNDPTTGEKINKLRKSYEGQMKSLNLSGRNKPDKRDDTPLLKIREWPDFEWHNQKVTGKKIELNEAFREKASKAMQMRPGNVRKQADWDNTLGHEKPLRAPLSTDTKPGPVTSSQIPNGYSATPQQRSATQERNRPSRAGKKRSYSDDSFAGYGEGFVDDEGDAAFSSDDTARGSGRKRRKKVSLDANSSNIAPD